MTDNEARKSRIEKALADLGKTSDEVAKSLRDAGVKGYPGRPCNCPIATYLFRFTDKELYLSVVPPVILVRKGDEIAFTIDLPNSVAMFIREFDRREAFRDLDRSFIPV